MGQNLKARGVVWEYALVVIATVAMTYTVQGAFKVAPDLHTAVWATALVSACAQAVLFVGVAKPRLRVPVGVVYVVLLVVAAGIGIACSTGEHFYEDAHENYFVPAIIYMVVPALVFLLSRNHLLSVLLLAVGVFTCAFVQFMYLKGMFIALVVFLLAAVLLVVLKNYQASTRTAAKLRSLAYGSTLGAGLVISLASVVLASLLVILVIMPLNPPAAEIKLETVYLAYEEVPVTGAVRIVEDSDYTVTSANTTDEVRTTTNPKIDPNADNSKVDAQAATGQGEDNPTGTYADVDLTSLAHDLDLVSYEQNLPWVLIAVACALVLLVLVFASRLLWRRLWLARVSKLPACEQVWRLYGLFLKRFDTLGFPKAQAATPNEYVRLNAERLRAYETPDGVGFAQVTDVLVATSYGSGASRVNLDALHEFYRNLPRAARKALGWPRYMLKYFRL